MTDDEVRQFFATIDRRDAAGFAEAFSEDGRFVFANAAPVYGRSAIREAVTAFFGTIDGLGHDITGIWRGRDGALDVVCVEATVTYSLRDGRTVALPSNSTMRLDGDTIRDYRITIDVAPVFAAA